MLQDGTYRLESVAYGTVPFAPPSPPPDGHESDSTATVVTVAVCLGVFVLVLVQIQPRRGSGPLFLIFGWAWWTIILIFKFSAAAALPLGFPALDFLARLSPRLAAWAMSARIRLLDGGEKKGKRKKKRVCVLALLNALNFSSTLL